MSEEQSNKPINNAYYHGRTTTKGEEAERYKPQLIDPSSPVPIDTDNGPQGSKWNKAQTFETVDFSTTQINTVLNQVFSDYIYAHKIQDGPVIKLGNVKSADGFAQRTFTRGKQVLTFELTIKFDILLNDEIINDAHVQFTEVDFTCTDDFGIKYVNIPVEYVKVLRTHEDKLRNKFPTFIKSMLALSDE